MKLMRASLVFIALLATLGLAGSFFVEASFLGRLSHVQPVKAAPDSQDGWELAGPPADLLNVPKAAFVTQGGPGIPPQVDIVKLSKDSEVVSYEPIRQTISTARWGALIAIVLTVGGSLALKRVAFTSPTED